MKYWLSPPQRVLTQWPVAWLVGRARSWRDCARARPGRDLCARPHTVVRSIVCWSWHELECTHDRAATLGTDNAVVSVTSSSSTDSVCQGVSVPLPDHGSPRSSVHDCSEVSWKMVGSDRLEMASIHTWWTNIGGILTEVVPGPTDILLDCQRFRLFYCGDTDQTLHNPWRFKRL